MSRVTCHVSHVIYLFFFFGQSDEVYRWMVCYQRGLSRLVCIKFSNRYLYWPNRGLIGKTNLNKTGFIILSRKGKGVWGDRYLFKTCKNSVFVFSSKTIHHVCFTKQGLCVAIQSLCIFQTEAHSCKERPLSSPNRAYFSTKQGIYICLILLFVFFLWLCLNPGFHNMRLEMKQSRYR